MPDGGGHVGGKRRPFSVCDLKRAVAAMERCGKVVTGVDIRRDGTFQVLTAEKTEVSGDPVDREIAEWGRKHGYG
jgi:hypothetical protein